VLLRVVLGKLLPQAGAPVAVLRLVEYKAFLTLAESADTLVLRELPSVLEPLAEVPRRLRALGHVLNN
jgi:hypothetical protein